MYSFCCFYHLRTTFNSGATGRSACNGANSVSNTQTTMHLAGSNTSAQAQSNGDGKVYCSSFCTLSQLKISASCRQTTKYAMYV